MSLKHDVPASGVTTSTGSLRTQASEAYLDQILNQVDRHTTTGLTNDQRQQIKTILEQSSLLERHPIDVRLSIPLFFMKFYLVLFIGRDKREVTQIKEATRAFLGKVLGRLFIVYLSLCIFLPVIFFALYIIKSWLGIDIFPDHHLSDFF